MTIFELFYVLSSSTMVSKGVDTMRSPCSALNVKVVQNKCGQTTGETMTLLFVVCVVSFLVLLSCLSHVLHVHMHVQKPFDVHRHTDVHVGAPFFAQFSCKKRSPEHLLSRMSAFRSL